MAGPIIHIHLNSHQQSLVDGFLHHHDRHERLSAIVDRSRRAHHLAPAERIPQNRVIGCSSSVWLISEISDGRCHFRSDADSPVVRGLVALLVDFFNHSTPVEIITSDADPLQLLDLKRGLTPTRRNGLAAVLATIRAFAKAQLNSPNPPIA
ncbi:MAG TPA: SufE family protein [Opitutus sp.]|nr:SufE family protein [Opitutus sp.]